MTNTKIEKLKSDITKTKNIILENQKKLRDLEQQKIDLENAEIIALYRRENLNDDDFSAVADFMRARSKNKNNITKQLQETKEEKFDEFDEA